jgi:hypothetical protein
MRLVQQIAMGLFCVAGLALAQDVKYNFDPGVNFAQYHTYKWVKIAGAEYPNQLLNQQIEQAINSQLAGKGLTMVTGENAAADLFVGYQTSIQKQQQYNTFNMGGGPWGGWGGMGGMSQTTSSTIDIGTLIVDIYDPKMKQLIWRGSATKTLNPSGNPEKNIENLNKSMAKLFKDYPPPPPKKKRF